MQNAESLSRDQSQEFLRSSEPIAFTSGGREERYQWVEQVLAAQQYGDLRKSERGVVRAYVRKMTGFSEAQTTRWIRGYLDQGVVRREAYQRHKFATKYTAADIALLAEVDRAHGRLSGPATRRILQRAYEQFGEKPYERLAKISVAHLYNLRASTRYRNQATVFEPTRRPLPPSDSAASRTRKGGRDMFAWTRYIKATARGSRGCTTSTPWTR